MRIIELFSGIGGFTKGFEAAGYEITEHYFSEIDKHAIANYKKNFPNAKHIGDVKSIQSGDFKGIDLITFGSPCQDFSLAGKRKGLEGERSSLIQCAIKLVTDLRPSLFIWENVKGAFSSNAGADFWAILQAFANIGNYQFEWQLLNTKWFLPQNRERIYLIGHLAGRSKPGVFPIEENDFVFREKAKSEKDWFQTQNSSTVTSRMGQRNTDTFISVPEISGTLTGGGNSGGLHSDMTTIKIGTLRTHNDGKGFRKVSDNTCPTIPARARQDGSGQPVIVAQRGRYTKTGIVQKFEENKEGTSNTLTGVQKDNLVKVHNTQPRSGDPTKGGTGHLSKYNESYCLDTGNTNAIEYEDNIRRLTEVECERLQGFPDDWTKYGSYDGEIKEIPKTQRYKMLGNAVTVKVVEEIATRIKNISL